MWHARKPSLVERLDRAGIRIGWPADTSGLPTAEKPDATQLVVE